MKATQSRKSAAPADPAKEHAAAACRAQEAIKKEPVAPENYTALAGALRTLAQSIHERSAEKADNLLHLACAAAWEAKRRSTPALISGRTKLEVKILTAWLRTRNHLSPEASETRMEQIRDEYLAKALNPEVPFAALGG
jgi:hypothetical protein